MKANGKNLKLFSYWIHDYMDLNPEQSFMTVKSEDEMKQFIDCMRDCWCSSTVSDPKEMSPEEFFNARQSDYWKGYELQLDSIAADCPQEWVDKYDKLLTWAEV